MLTSNGDYLLTLYDFVLMPTNLFIVEMNAPSVNLGISTGRYFKADSIGYPRADIYSRVFNVSGDTQVSNLSVVKNGPVSLPIDKDMRLWFVALDAVAINSFAFTSGATIIMTGLPRYRFARGLL